MNQNWIKLIKLNLIDTQSNSGVLGYLFLNLFEINQFKLILEKQMQF